MIITESGKKLYSYNDVAAVIGVTAQTLYKYVKQLELSLYPVSGKLHFEESQIVQVIEARSKVHLGRKPKKASK